MFPRIFFLNIIYFKMWLKVIILVNYIFCLSAGSDLVIKSPAGTFKGHYLNTRDGRRILAFQGIPYAKPPVGSLRLKDTEKVDKLENIWDATDDSKECYQPIFDFQHLSNMTLYTGSEDCLYLNVYIPELIEFKKDLPVFVWIHGGGFFMASGSTFYNGPEFFLDKDMILVTINYRLGLLGFLSTGNSVVPGNLGMKDQVMALKWVQENIKSFGGDKEQVTIGGESAGAAAVVHHLHSPLSKGLFKRAIAQSGSMDCHWATQSAQEAQGISKKFATQIGCPFNEEIIECLQTKPVEQLFLAAHAIKSPMGVLSMEFVPVIEEDGAKSFLTEKSIRSPSSIPLIIGVTNYESLAMPAFLAAVNDKYKDLNRIAEDVNELLPICLYYSSHSDSTKITSQLVDFYFGNKGITNESHENLINLVGDMMFNHGVYTRARKHKADCYLYMFSYKGQISTSPFVPEGLKDGVGHSEDLSYLFDFKFIKHEPFNQKDRAMSDLLVDTWFNFISGGNPTPENEIWEKSEGGTKYLEFTNDGLFMKSNIFENRMKFLDGLNIDKRGGLHHEEL